MQTTDVSRNQFTFYRSYYEAALMLPKSRQLEALQAIIEYALDGVMPPRLSPKSEAVLTAIRPNLDLARLKASRRLESKSEPESMSTGNM